MFQTVRSYSFQKSWLPTDYNDDDDGDGDDDDETSILEDLLRAQKKFYIGGCMAAKTTIIVPQV